MAVAVAEHSLLRHLIPLYVTGSGSYSSLLRHAFLHDEKDQLITVFLQSIEQAHIPLLPRMLLAEGFQRLLEEDTPQREVREIFETASMQTRRLINSTDEYNVLHKYDQCKQTSSTEYNAINSITSNNNKKNKYKCNSIDRNNVKEEECFQYLPYERLLMHEVIATAEYYANALSISSTPLISASVLLRSRIVSDLFRDTLLRCCFNDFQQLPRDEWTGKRKEELHPIITQAVKELLLLERDVFGIHRFDQRSGNNRYLLYNIRLQDIAATQRNFSILLDPLIEEYGNFYLTNRLVNSNHWREYTLSCSDHEDHRILPTILPTHKILIAHDELLSKPTEMTIYYNHPICHYRQERDTFVPIKDTHYAEVFELAEPDRNRTKWERWFLDR